MAFAEYVGLRHTAVRWVLNCYLVCSAHLSTQHDYVNSAHMPLSAFSQSYSYASTTLLHEKSE
jgi:hypothetical protein